MRTRHPVWLLGSCGLLAVALSPAQGIAGGGASAEGPPLAVVTTTTVLADLAAQVGGERVSVQSLVPAGADPHIFEPSPQHALAASRADVLLGNGLGLEGWLERLLRSAARDQARIVLLGEGLAGEQAGEETAAAPGGGSEDDHAHGPVNPHLWLDVQYAMAYVERIRAALEAADPSGAVYYRERARRYLDELRELDGWLTEQLAAIPPQRRLLPTVHAAFDHLARRYGLEVVAITATSAGREPSARELADLARRIRDSGVGVLFAGPHLDPRWTQTLAGETGVRVVTLYSDSLDEKVPTYVEMMRHNGRALREGLQ